jgi:hypothetical protein
VSRAGCAAFFTGAGASSPLMGPTPLVCLPNIRCSSGSRGALGCRSKRSSEAQRGISRFE